jgi:hypothetical protein
LEGKEKNPTCTARVGEATSSDKLDNRSAETCPRKLQEQQIGALYQYDRAKFLTFKEVRKGQDAKDS